MNRGLFVTLSIMLMLVATFVLIRIIIPGLVNMHNDGALILVVLLMFGAVAAWWGFVTFLIKLVKGDFN